MKNPTFLRFILVILILGLFQPFGIGKAAPGLQADDAQARAQELLDRLTPEERVGQLFLVTFKGPEAAPGTPDANQIYDLIVHEHIGGVILLQSSDNILGQDQTIPILQSLTDQLQRDEYGGSLQAQKIPGSDETFTPAFIPLFIGVSQDGDGYPYDQILSGLTPLPSQMAIGATWNPELATKVGQVLGNELNILGINLLIGPSLDVLIPPFSDAANDLGIRTFGGDPFWVGEMGRAYITGIHEGSNHRIVVVGKHFPGYGGSDRLPEDEVATVRKTLEQLKQFELYPFFAVTGNAPSTDATADALLTSHIRFQGFQENFRQTTKPISFDPSAFSVLMSQPALKTWRDNGGVMITDNLGSRAVRRFYDPTGQTFNGRAVALDAFLAGNDMLYLGNFVSSGDPDSYTSITHTIASFALKYREDTAFAQRVDASVLRNLTLKVRLYGPDFMLNKTLPAPERANQLGNSGQVTFEVAQQAATLISPPPGELDPIIPTLLTKIVFVNDTRLYQQCSMCSLKDVLPVNSLEQAVIRLYSPQAGGQILPRDLASYSFADLQNMLTAGPGQMEIEASLKQADWIVFVMLDANPNIPSSLALKHFLDLRPDLIQGKRLVVFAMNVPYHLDATEISKLTAYYGLYSRSPQFIEVAARLLFQEIRPSGSLPVSVPGVGYDLNTVTFPDPAQVIPLTLDLPAESSNQETPTPDLTPTPQVLRIGSAISVRTGIILDHNGRMVPDGTVARFILAQAGEQGIVKQVETQTVKGVARATFQVDNAGNLSIRVESDPAKQSEVLLITIPPENVTVTAQTSPTHTVTGTLQPTLTITTTPTPEPTRIPNLESTRHTNFGDWFISLLVTGAIALASYWLGFSKAEIRWGIRAALLAVIGGILAYSYIALEMPGSSELLQRGGTWGVMLCAMLGAVVGSAAALAWRRFPSQVK